MAPLVAPRLESRRLTSRRRDSERTRVFKAVVSERKACFGTCCAACLGELCCYFCLVPGRSCSGGGDQQRGGCLGGRGDRRRRLFYSGGFHCVPHEKKQQDFILLIIQNCVSAERLAQEQLYSASVPDLSA